MIARAAAWRRPVGLTALAALVVWAWRGTGVDLASLASADALRQVADYAARLVPPDLSRPALTGALTGALETLAISVVGSAAAVVVAAPLALGATRALAFRTLLLEPDRSGVWQAAARVVVYGLSKTMLAVCRTVPEIVWALLFVFVVGLGPFPGVLALTVHTAGVLGKLFAEALESVDRGPIEALQSTGASRFALVVYGFLPQALPQFFAYALYRWEVNIRAAAVLGFVGAGGLGQRIHVAVSLFHEHELLTLVLAVYAMVTVVDGLSAFLRARLA